MITVMSQWEFVLYFKGFSHKFTDDTSFLFHTAPLIMKLPSKKWLTCSRVHFHSAGFPPQRSRWWSEPLLLETWWGTWVVHTQISSTEALWARSAGQAQSGSLQGGGYTSLLRCLQNVFRNLLLSENKHTVDAVLHTAKCLMWDKGFTTLQPASQRPRKQDIS